MMESIRNVAYRCFKGRDEEGFAIYQVLGATLRVEGGVANNLVVSIGTMGFTASKIDELCAVLQVMKEEMESHELS